jgi:hypothetical protein
LSVDHLAICCLTKLKEYQYRQASFSHVDAVVERNDFREQRFCKLLSATSSSGRYAYIEDLAPRNILVDTHYNI